MCIFIMIEWKWTYGDESQEKSYPPVETTQQQPTQQQPAQQQPAQSNKREEACHKIMERTMIPQYTGNPFIGTSNYADNLYLQDTLIRRLSSPQR